MRCASCGSDNPAGAKFCIECAAPLPRRCTSCGTENPPQAKFCAECATPLSAPVTNSLQGGANPQPTKQTIKSTKRGEAKSPQPRSLRRSGEVKRGAPEAERRQLTVMFCDLVGSTALSAQLDPEELHEVVRAYQETCATVIRRYDGHIAQHLGDGLLVYFGYPVAHEDDAARAVRSGLGILEALPALKARSPRPIQVRIGIHTGPVVVGEIGSGEKREQLALGETPNLAARIQGQAAPDEMVISAVTYRLVEGLFECEERGRPELRGAATLLSLYRVVKEGEAQSRFQAVARKGLTPLVGRDHEHGLLQERWERVKDGAGQVVLLCGEPGIGKSRLVEVLKEAVEREGAPCLELRCSPYAQNSALQPVIEHLQRRLEFRLDDLPETNFEKLQQALGYARFCQAETLPLLAALLSLPLPPEVPPLTLSPQRQKEKTYDAVVAWLCEEARDQAVAYAWEDLQWADPSTLELLAGFLEQVPTTRLLVVLTFRPEFTPPWGARSYLSQLTLSRLGRGQVATMVEKVTGGKALPAEVVQQIVSKTDGVPLFVEELTKMVMESDLVREVEGHYELSQPLPPLAIPATLQDSLMARLDRLASVREIAQLGATIGREFNYDLLQAVSPLAENTLQQGLRQLVEVELIFQSGVPPHARYLFKHALVQDTAYQSLLKSRRQQLHQQVAQVLVEQFPELVEAQPELVAHHYTEAGFSQHAIPYWHRAGQRAIERSANVEAVRHLSKGLTLLKTLPDTAECAQQELTLQLTLGALLLAVQGYGAPGVEQAYSRALELCRHLGEPTQRFAALGGLWQFFISRADYHKAYELAEESLTVAQHVQDPALRLGAYDMLGQTYYVLGEFVRARYHLEQGLALSDLQSLRSSAFLVGGEEPGLACRGFAAFTLFHLGFPDRALQQIHEAFRLAQQLHSPFNSAWIFAIAAQLHQFRQEARIVQERAEALMALSTEHGFAEWLAMGTLLRGWARAAQGQTEAGLGEMCQGWEAYQATGTQLVQPYFLALLAEAYRAVRQPEEGLRMLTEALAAVDKTGERYYEAELYRLKGELTLQQSSGQRLASRVASTQHPAPRTPAAAEAEACFLKAIEIARKQSAKSLELRAVMSLSRLWQSQGKKDEAHAMLSEIYGWFTEGFDTKDLQEAKTLLGELAEGV